MGENVYLVHYREMVPKKKKEQEYARVSTHYYYLVRQAGDRNSKD